MSLADLHWQDQRGRKPPAPPPAPRFERFTTMAEYLAARAKGLTIYLRDSRNDDEPGEEPGTFGEVWERTGHEHIQRWLDFGFYEFFAAAPGGLGDLYRDLYARLPERAA